MSNNPPYRVVELDKETYEFIIANCDQNITFGLNALQNPAFSRPTLEKLVDVMEKFKAVKKALEAGK